MILILEALVVEETEPERANLFFNCLIGTSVFQKIFLIIQIWKGIEITISANCAALDCGLGNNTASRKKLCRCISKLR